MKKMFPPEKKSTVKKIHLTEKKFNFFLQSPTPADRAGSWTREKTFFHRSQRWKKPTERKKKLLFPPQRQHARGQGRGPNGKRKFCFTSHCGETNRPCGHNKQLKRPQLNGTNPMFWPLAAVKKSSLAVVLNKTFDRRANTLRSKLLFKLTAEVNFSSVDSGFR